METVLKYLSDKGIADYKTLKKLWMENIITYETLKKAFIGFLAHDLGVSYCVKRFRLNETTVKKYAKLVSIKNLQL